MMSDAVLRVMLWNVWRTMYDALCAIIYAVLYVTCGDMLMCVTFS